VTLWDTMTLSGEERFQVLAAGLAAKAGWARQAIQQRLEEIRAHTEVIFTLETVEYLARRCRIGRVQALAGLLLSIKPIIRVDHGDGKYSTVGRSRTVSRALETIADHLHTRYAGTPLWVTVMHGHLADRAEALVGRLNERLNIAKLERMRISPVLGVHTGPGIVGAAVMPLSRVQDLE
jgi:fatty acid kinase fatty acid binding subunit